MTGSRALLERLAAASVASAARDRTVVDSGPFRLCLSPRSDLFYINQAFPMSCPDDWRPAVERLIDTFVEWRRTPFLEFFADLWPALPAALEAAGFELQMIAPVQTLSRPPAETALPEGVRFRLLDSGESDASVRAFIDTGAASFGLAPEAANGGRAPELRRAIAAGAQIHGILHAGGEPAAVASIVVSGEIGELAGVGTLPLQRRRGLAAALCRRLLARFFAEHERGLVWLSAGGEAAHALYTSLGFIDTGKQLNYIRKL